MISSVLTNKLFGWWFTQVLLSNPKSVEFYRNMLKAYVKMETLGNTLNLLILISFMLHKAY